MNFKEQVSDTGPLGILFKFYLLRFQLATHVFHSLSLFIAGTLIIYIY